MNSRAKGAAGERELANLLKTYGYDARRGQQYSGLAGNPDVIGLSGIHIECKRVQQFRDEVSLQQSERDARSGELPVVMHRRNREEWKVTMRLDNFMLIWGELTDKQKIDIADKIKFLSKPHKIGG